MDEFGRTCNRCGNYEKWESFAVNSKGLGGRKSICKTCSNKAQKKLYKHRKESDPSQFKYEQRERMLWKKYSLTVEEFNRILDYQSGICAICGKPESCRENLVVDHCHKTGEVRGLLCNLCNSALGKFGDNPKIVSKALDYLYNPTYKGGYLNG